jgi:predicted dehydrogenase
VEQVKKATIGFIGAGWWATTNHMPILAARSDVELTAVCRPGREQLSEVQSAFGFLHATEDYRELLELELDGVIVCSPHHLHYEHAIAALGKGRHVMCEKPMTLEPDQAWELVHEAERKEVELLVPYGWNYKPFVATAKQLVSEIGRVEFVLCHMASPTKGFFGGADEGGVPSVWEPSIAAPDPATWQVAANGGGYGHGQITHSSALLFWLTGLRAARVSARTSNAGAPVDLYDAAHVEFDNGAIGVVSGAATLPDDSKFQVDIRIFGSDGVLMLDVERERLELLLHDGSRRAVEIEAESGAYTCDVPPVRFVELIHGKGVNESPGGLAAKTVELIDALHRSAARGGAEITVAA